MKNSVIGNEDGSTIIIAMLMLAVLTILGISSINTTSVELKIVGNEKLFQRDFYVADSAWKYGAYWLEDQFSPPSFVNTDSNFTDEELDLVRNYGDAAQNDLNESFLDGTQDGTLDAIPFWYNLQFNKSDVLPGSGKNYRKFEYIVKSSANKTQGIEVRVAKVYKIGY